MREICMSGSTSGMWKRSMVQLMRHRQTKGPGTDRPDLTHRATSRLYPNRDYFRMGGYPAGTRKSPIMNRLAAVVKPMISGVFLTQLVERCRRLFRRRRCTVIIKVKENPAVRAGRFYPQLKCDGIYGALVIGYVNCMLTCIEVDAARGCRHRV